MNKEQEKQINLELKMARYLANSSNYHREFGDLPTITANDQANKANTHYFVVEQLQAGLSYEEIYERWPWVSNGLGKSSKLG